MPWNSHPDDASTVRDPDQDISGRGHPGWVRSRNTSYSFCPVEMVRPGIPMPLQFQLISANKLKFQDMVVDSGTKSLLGYVLSAFCTLISPAGV